MLKVYGCSDDLVEIEGAEYPNDEIGCFERDVKIKFTDGWYLCRECGHNWPTDKQKEVDDGRVH